MKDKKKDTFIFKGFGFPVKLINVPMKKLFGKWAIDINMNQLMLVILHALIHKSTPLNGKELKFIRSYLQMTTTIFGKQFGISHVAVLKWENGKNQISPALEFCIRLYMLDHLQAKDKEFRSFYKEFNLEQLSKALKKKIYPLTVDAATDDLKIAL